MSLHAGTRQKYCARMQKKILSSTAQSIPLSLGEFSSPLLISCQVYVWSKIWDLENVPKPSWTVK